MAAPSKHDSPPPRITGPSAWYGPDLDARRDWIEDLTSSEISEIELATKNAVAQMKNPRDDIPRLRAKDFALPTIGPRLKRMLDEILNGRGFVLIRGMPIERWSKLERATAFFGIGTHLGNARSQNAKGHVLGHVKDLGKSASDPATRLYQTNERQGYHTDSCDVVGLMCLQRSKSGGLSSLVSSITLYNEISRRRSDLIDCLFEPIATDRRGEVGPGQEPYFTIPVFNWHEGLLSAIYQRKYIDSARKLPGVPPYTAKQVEALDLLDQLVDDPALHLRMDFQPGDMQFVHNHSLLHDRTAFEDFPEPEKKRHLLRLWLAPVNARPLPSVFAERFGSVVPGERGGVMVEGMKLISPLDAE